MLDDAVKWFKGLKWYWWLLGALVVAGAFILSLGGRVGKPGRPEKQLKALDDLRKKQTDEELHVYHGAVRELRDNLEENKEEVQLRQANRTQIEKDLVAATEELTQQDNPSIDDIDAWRKKHGV